MGKGKNKRKQLYELPDITLHTDSICRKAELEGKYCIESEVRGVGYVYDNGVLNVLTGTHGYIYLKEEDIEKLACEMLDIVESIRELKKIRKLQRKEKWVFNDDREQNSNLGKTQSFG